MLKRILGLVGWLGVALVFAAVFAKLGPYTQFQPYSNPLAIAGLFCTLLYILSQWREIGQSFSGRNARYGTLAAGSVLVVIAILGAINYLASRHNRRWDLTAAHQFTLSDQTKKVLHDLKEPVTIRVFAVTQEFPRYHDRLDQYTYQSKLVKTEYIDLEKQPPMGQRYGINTPGTVLFEYKGRTEKVTAEGEQDLTNGLIKAIKGRQPKIYFTQGHGEKDPSNSDRAGYSSIGTAMTNSNFVTDKIALAQVTAVPADADIIIIAGPRTDFFAPEIDLLKAYLARGGKLLVLLDPVLKADQPQPVLLQGLLKEWGIEAGNDVVLDVSGMGRLLNTDESVPVVINYPPHPITENFAGLLTAYPLARSMSPIEGAAGGKSPQKIVQTSASSWAESDLKSLTGGQPAKADGNDKRGPVSLAVAVSAPASNPPVAPAKDSEDEKKAESRIVAFGDSDFAGNNALGVQGNRDLFLNTLNWLSQDEDLIAIRPRDPEDRRITLTVNQQRLIFYLTVVIVPGLILLAGVQTWWRRR